jgi:hypothetical protein
MAEVLKQANEVSHVLKNGEELTHNEFLSIKLSQAKVREEMLSKFVNRLSKLVDIKSTQFNLALKTNKDLRLKNEALGKQAKEAFNAWSVLNEKFQKIQLEACYVSTLKSDIAFNNDLFVKTLMEKDIIIKKIFQRVQWQRVLNEILSYKIKNLERGLLRKGVTICATRSILCQTILERKELKQKLISTHGEMLTAQDQVVQEKNNVSNLRIELKKVQDNLAETFMRTANLERTKAHDDLELVSLRESVSSMRKEINDLDIPQFKKKIDELKTLNTILTKKLKCAVDKLSLKHLQFEKQKKDYEQNLTVAARTNSELTLLVNQLNIDITHFRNLLATCMMEPIKVLDSTLNVIQKRVPLEFLVSNIEAESPNKKIKQQKTKKKQKKLNEK